MPDSGSKLDFVPKDDDDSDIHSEGELPPQAYFHIVSDATGNLAAHMIRAVMTQFKELRIRRKFHVFIKKEAELREAIESIDPDRALVFHSLVRRKHKAALQEVCDRRGIPHHDLTGSLADFIAHRTGEEQARDLHGVHTIDERYLQRIKAMEFTAQHDDSRRLDTLHEAEVVIVGLSRVSKSPTSTFLGSFGLKTANVAVSMQVPFPKELDAVADRVVAFTMQPKALFETRKRRFKEIETVINEQQFEQLEYYDLRSVIQEVMGAEEVYRRRGYPIVNITDRTVEENAATVLKLLGLKIAK